MAWSVASRGRHSDPIDETDEVRQVRSFNFTADPKETVSNLLYIQDFGLHALLPQSLRIRLCYDQQTVMLHHDSFVQVWEGEG